MSIFGSIRGKSTADDHWVPIEPSRHIVEQEPLCLLEQRLESALADLGRMDYQLGNAIARLRTDIATETHDNLHAHVSQLIEPGLRSAITQLADEIARAKNLTKEVVANSGNASKVSLRRSTN